MRRSRADSERLLVYRDGGRYRELHAEDVNTRFKELTGTDCTAKDLRTWQATVLAAAGFGRVDPPSSQRARKSAEREVVAEVAAALGNTPAVARASYIDPRVIESFAGGVTISKALARAARSVSEDGRQMVVERAVIRLLHRVAR
ncbi:hypothetical protein [Nocardia anaemiae]|uniref:hypothetical protein n=1 Tax=Nocardia anaemiae TaxID=263910 RepID=UPI0007A41028